MTATTHQEVMAALERYDTTWKDWKAKTDSDLDSLGKTLADVQLAAGRPRFGAAGGTHGEAKALHKALIEFARSGDECELKAMTAGDDSSGGYLVVPVMDQAVRQIRDQVSPLSAHVRNVPLETGGEFRMPYFRGTLDSGWVAESESRPETSTLPAGEHAIALHEVYAAPKVSQKLLDTATYDVGSILIEQIAHGLASAEAVAIHTGNGVGRPRGFSTYTMQAAGDSTRTWGSVEYIASGKAAAFASVAPTDCLNDAVGALAPAYRANAKWLMSRQTAATLRKMKDADGVSLWQPALRAGDPSSLLGYEVIISDAVPAVTSGSLSVWLADWAQAYTVVRQPGLRLLRDPYSTKGQVTFYTYARVGGALTNPNAAKAIKFATS